MASVDRLGTPLTSMFCYTANSNRIRVNIQLLRPLCVSCPSRCPTPLTTTQHPHTRKPLTPMAAMLPRGPSCTLGLDQRRSKMYAVARHALACQLIRFVIGVSPFKKRTTLQVAPPLDGQERTWICAQQGQDYEVSAARPSHGKIAWYLKRMSIKATAEWRLALPTLKLTSWRMERRATPKPVDPTRPAEGPSVAANRDVISPVAGRSRHQPSYHFHNRCRSPHQSDQVHRQMLHPGQSYR